MTNEEKWDLEHKVLCKERQKLVAKHFKVGLTPKEELILDTYERRLDDLFDLMNPDFMERLEDSYR